MTDKPSTPSTPPAGTSKPPAKQAPQAQAEQPQPISVTVPADAASTNFYWLINVGDQSFNLQTTLRGNLSALQVDAHISTILDGLATVVGLGGVAKAVGATAYAGGNGHTAAQPQSPADSLPMGESIPMTGDKQTPRSLLTESFGSFEEPEYVPPEPDKIGDLAFDTQKLIVEESTKDGQTKRLYKIGGGKFMKYGVRVWDEVLVSIGIKLDQLKVKEYPMTGYTAFCDTNNEGHPTKVVRLTKKP